MRPALIRLVDLGLDRDFGATMTFAQSVIEALTTARAGGPHAEIEFVRVADLWAVRGALQAPADVLHVTAHGSNDPDTLGFSSAARPYRGERLTLHLPDLAKDLAADGWGIDSAVLIADGCVTGQARFLTAVRDCLQNDTCYIGTTRSTTWHEATVFASAFYGAYLKNRGRGLTPIERGEVAGQRAMTAYETILDAACPFKVQRLTPSRSALAAFTR